MTDIDRLESISEVNELYKSKDQTVLDYLRFHTKLELLLQKIKWYLYLLLYLNEINLKFEIKFLFLFQFILKIIYINLFYKIKKTIPIKKKQ